ncbi:GlsB/YeaQ/YmgE family stress response membrane protein [Streptococcus cuniculipharyngis]|uniref:GlsB/YeaQ/YmgE family stress response membrane protein n=1 Tax=Streptococcus cuniculipharyngis TaxID=1562651 RepID=A0A5C5SEJ0_9STRE|nr:GlsB/YeaQ/YmgE family stress response membrane protein [Streptococcus cuniculipharyngis]TWS98710.1 GlsB/YeaQ/YmgE family stress response membrane protein [Streptococcus cuniculipharyngis]
MLNSIIIGALIGWLAGMITKRNDRIGCLTRIIVGLLGASLGQFFFGHWGPRLGDTALIPSILGAMIILTIFIAKSDR